MQQRRRLHDRNATNGLIGHATFRNNALAAGLPANFFVANPDALNRRAPDDRITAAREPTRCSSSIRKRLSSGLAFNTSYTWSDAFTLQQYGYTRPLEYIEQAGQVGNVAHALKGNWIWEVPFGHDRKYGSGVPGVVDAIVGGWSFDGVARIQTGEQLDFGNVRLVGMTQKDLQKVIKIQQGADGPDLHHAQRHHGQHGQGVCGERDVADRLWRARGADRPLHRASQQPDCIESAPGYGDCGLRNLVVNGPKLVRFDLGLSKKFRLWGNVTFDFRGEMLNALNTPYFNPASNAAASRSA